MIKISIENDLIKISLEESTSDEYRFASEIMIEFDVDRKNGSIFLELQDAIRLKEMISLNSKIDLGNSDLALLESVIDGGSKLRDEIEKLKSMTYEELSANLDYLNFKNTIKENIKVDFEEGDFVDVTRKQSTKAYAMSKLENVLNFSEPGAGKTIMTLMNLVNKIDENEKVLIVSPINSMNVWKEEIKKFLNWSRDKKMVHFFNEKMHSKFSDMPNKDISNFIYARFILINYESVQKISDNETLMEPLLSRGYHIVFDEVHRIKNGNSIRNIRSKKISEMAKSRTTLTGTPFSTSVDEIKQIVNITWPKGNPFISTSKFDDYVSDISLYDIDNDVTDSNDLDYPTLKNVNDLAHDISPLYFSLSKKRDFNIQEAIDKHNDPIVVKPLLIQREIDSMIWEKITKINSMISSGHHDKSIREKLEKTRNALYTAGEQNLVNPNLLYEYESFRNYFKEKISFNDLPKIKEVVNLVKELTSDGRKVMVWFTFVKNILELKELLNNLGIRTEEIHGDTKQQDRQRIIDSFSKKDSDIQVLISNPATIAESISLHKSVYDSIFVERTMSYFRWAQAKDRIHRVGSNETVTHNYLINENLKMDKKVFDNLRKKDILAKEILKKNPFENIGTIKKLLEEEKHDLEEAGYDNESREFYNKVNFDDVSNIINEFDDLLGDEYE